MFSRCFGDIHMWGQIWPHKVWTSLCQVLFFSKPPPLFKVLTFDKELANLICHVICTTLPTTPSPSPPQAPPQPPSLQPHSQRASMCNSYTPRYLYIWFKLCCRCVIWSHLYDSWSLHEVGWSWLIKICWQVGICQGVVYLWIFHLHDLTLIRIKDQE